jgi:hypothetical protein
VDKLSIILGVSNLFVGLLCLGLSWPLYTGKVGRNHIYGFRTKKTLASDDVWYAVNRYAARRMLPWAAGLAGLGAATLMLPLEQHPKLAVAIGLAPLVVLIPCLQGLRYCRDIAAQPNKKKRKRKK